MTQPAEVRLYLDRANDALKQAEDNLKLGHFDVATSRAYYAMFYAASAILVSQGISRSKHSGVHAAFGQYFVKPGLIEPEYGRMLINAFNVRLDSDYEVKPTLSKGLAEDILRDAGQFVERAAIYLNQEGYL
jgi:uncharacterized protein (UPF0332 family)